MTCPYAKNIKGTIAYCDLLKKKVSTLRFPCKGNYKRCPIYARYTARKRAAPAPPIAEESVITERKPEAKVEKKAKLLLKPSDALCDSLILASLLTSGKAEDRFRGTLSELVDKLEKEKLESDQLYFIIGTIESYSFRAVFRNKTLTYMFEKSGATICGDEAKALFAELKNTIVDAIVYVIKLEEIPLWKETILKELE